MKVLVDTFEDYLHLNHLAEGEGLRFRYSTLMSIGT